MQPLVVSILSERRAFQPYGMQGGEPGARGLNLLWTGGGGGGGGSKGGQGQGVRRTISLGGKNTVEVFAGDRLTILSPGGGAWGEDTPGAATIAGASKDGTACGAAAVPVRSSGSLLQYTLDQESV